MTDIRISEFEEYCREQLGLSSHSLRAYVQDLQSFVRYASGAKIAIPPSSEELVQFHRYLRETMGASAATIRRRFVTLRSYFRWVEEECGGEKSPFQGLRLELKVPRRLPRPIDRPTLDVLFRSSRSITEIDRGTPARKLHHGDPDQITGLVARLLVVTGLRISEITNLRLHDVSGGCSQMRVRGKGNRERTVYVTNTKLLEEFRCYWQHRIENAHSNAHLFMNSRGERLTEAAFRKRLRAVSKSLFIEPYLTPHRFRHSAATLLIEEGVDIRFVQRLLGHASISTTELYTKVSDNSLVAAIRKADTLALIDS